MLAEILGLSERFRVTDEEQVRGPLARKLLQETHTFTHSNTNTHTWLNKVAEPLIAARSELVIITT